MTSLWRDLAAAAANGDAAPTARYEGAVSPGERFDVAVVGAHSSTVTHPYGTPARIR